MSETIERPVGLRNRRTNVPNRTMDQQTIIHLLSRIRTPCGGKRETWGRTPPTAGPDGRCPQALADAIWEFQDVWQRKGLFTSVDGVVDPGRRTIRHMNALLNGVCGPVIDEQFRRMLTRIQADFRGWTRAQKDQACTRILIPATLVRGTQIPSFQSLLSDPTRLVALASSIRPDIDGWDVLPLFQGNSGWLRRQGVLSRGCATPSSPKPRADAMDSAHEDPCTCSNSVQIGGRCWLNGTVNYGTFGMMVRLCAEEFVPRFFRSWLLDYAILLIRGYKGVINPEDATLPIAWTRATFNGGASGVPDRSIAGNRPHCACGCRLNGSIVRWDYVWEPVKRRDTSVPPEASATEIVR